MREDRRAGPRDDLTTGSDDAGEGASDGVGEGVGGADDRPTESWRQAFDDLERVDRAVIASVVAGTSLLAAQADLLMRLVVSPDRHSPMNALAIAMRVSGSSLTKLVDRLSDVGLTRRDASAQDRRVVYVTLTAEGADEATRLRARYAAALRTRVVDVLGADAADLASLARRLV